MQWQPIIYFYACKRCSNALEASVAPSIIRLCFKNAPRLVTSVILLFESGECVSCSDNSKSLRRCEFTMALLHAPAHKRPLSSFLGFGISKCCDWEKMKQMA